MGFASTALQHAAPSRQWLPLKVVECALVTGAASGIGRAFARALAARKQNLLLVDRNELPLRRLSEDLAREHRVRVEWLIVDLSDPAAPLEVARCCQRRSLRVVTLVNNAGVGFRSPFATQARAVAQQILDVNVMALVRLTRLFLPRMIRRRPGVIINVGSIAAYVPSPSTALYAASKAFIASFTESLAMETAGTGVRVTNVCPGLTDTPLLDTFGLRGSPRTQSPGDVVEQALAGVERSQRLVVTGFDNRIRVWAHHISLRWAIRRALEMIRRCGRT